MVAGVWRELEYNVSQFGVQEDNINAFVPKEEITTIPPGWNEEDTMTDYQFLHDYVVDDLSIEYHSSKKLCEDIKSLRRKFYSSFDFLNDPREDVYSLKDGEEII